MTRHPDALSATFAALSDPTRRAILARLSQGESNVSALAEPFQISLPAITKHLQVLERAGLVDKGRDAQRRPCRINAAPLKQATDWIAQYRQFWEARLDRLDAYLQQLQAAEARGNSPSAHPSPRTAPSRAPLIASKKASSSPRARKKRAGNTSTPAKRNTP